ncbi:MAG: SIR2 family NAD-dependent protein deacylase [Actinomycetota bacterium]
MEQVKDLNVLDRAELIARQQPQVLRDVVADACDVSQHALSHALLSGLGCREVVTTNFDRCFELADADQHVRVLPWEAPNPGAPWLLKMHGDVRHPESIVLTRGDFATYDARYRPAASVLQALILTRHVLFVGASMTDDNVLRLAYEVSRLRQDHHLSHQWGTVLDVGRSDAKRALYARDLAWVSFDGESLQDRARQLEIFLDVVTCYATDDSSWLLDPDFAPLDPEGAQVARELRKLVPDIRRLAAHNPAWTRIAETLGRHGAGEGGVSR